ncbi:MAG: flagellar protein FlaG, partial [Candidatus Hydrogenedentes bacterium]|nr:flagellar protein FlaG [Candidatus Hydrogenedentota bacterium]
RDEWKPDGDAGHAVEESALQPAAHGVRFRVDEATDQVIALIVDRSTHEVIRQVPSEELVNLTRRLREFVGLMFDTAV